MHSFGQKDNGYFGKKAFIQVQSLMNYPFFYNVFGSIGYAQSGNHLVAKKDNFNTGYRISAGYSVKRNISLIFEFGQDFSSVYLPDYASVDIDGYNIYVKHEMIDVTTTVFMPIIEFGSSKALLPMGLSHQIGFGISNSKAKEKDYMFQYENDYWGGGPGVTTSYQKYSTSDNDPLNFDNLDPVKKYIVMYGLSMRSPITKSLMINYGIKYTLNLGKPKYVYNNSIEYQLKDEMSKQRTYSFINLNLGLSFVF